MKQGYHNRRPAPPMAPTLSVRELAECKAMIARLNAQGQVKQQFPLTEAEINRQLEEKKSCSASNR